MVATIDKFYYNRCACMSRNLSSFVLIWLLYIIYDLLEFHTHEVYMWPLPAIHLFSYRFLYILCLMCLGGHASWWVYSGISE